MPTGRSDRAEKGAVGTAAHYGRKSPAPSPDAYADLLRALSAIGNNINQLAHQANARGAATGDEITEALHLVRQATRLVRGAALNGVYEDHCHS